MKICLIGYRGNPYSGGQGIYMYHLTRELTALGHEVDVIVGPPYPMPLEQWASVHKVTNLNLWGQYRREWLPKDKPFSLFQPWNLFDFAATRLRFFSEPFSFSFRAWAKLAWLLKTKHFDILHDVQSLGYGTLFMKPFGIPIITTVHHPLTIDRKESYAKDRSLNQFYHTTVFFPVGMQGRVIRRINHVITASIAGQKAIEQDFKVASEKISIVPNGLDTELFTNPGKWARRKDTLLFVGNTGDQNKGLIFLLKAMKILPDHITLRIVDEPNPLRTTMHHEVKRLGLENRVTFTGKISEKALLEEYCRATLLVQPSLFEGFGLPAAEALSCETPVLATDVGAVSEVIHPETGLLVPPGSPQALASGVETLLSDPERRKVMGKKGREDMLKNFSWPAAARHTETVYKKLLGWND